MWISYHVADPAMPSVAFVDRERVTPAIVSIGVPAPVHGSIFVGR